MKHERSTSMRKGWSVFNRARGASLIEVILATATLTLVLTALSGVYLYGQESTATAGARARALLLAEEGLEAVRNMRDADFANVTDGTYGLATSTGVWTLTGSSDSTDIFTRTVTIASVDADRKSVVSNVTWQQNAQRTGSVSLASRLAYWTRIVETVGDWSQATTSTSLDLSTNNNGLRVQVAGDYAYVVRSGGNDFSVIDISDPDAPSEVATLSLAGTLSNVYVSGNYAYVTSNDNSAELLIIDITTPDSPTVAGTYNDSGSDDAHGVVVSGSYAYLALHGGNDLVVVNVSNPASPTFTGGVSLNGNAYDVVVSGSYAYVVTSDNSREVQAVNIATPSAPAYAGSLNLSGNNDATTIALAGTTLYVGQADMLRTVDISSPSSPALLGSYDADDTINDIASNLANSDTLLFLATNENNTEFQIIDVSTPATPDIFGSVDLSSNENLNGLAYSTDIDRVIGVGDNNATEIVIFEPQ